MKDCVVGVGGNGRGRIGVDEGGSVGGDAVEVGEGVCEGNGRGFFGCGSSLGDRTAACGEGGAG